ncbi:solute carrier family 46 member 3-like [Acanthaster planci]|uniref:Proton-coupled folate transporter n=1 Tax=Acanthaster planci TaxID=133434 RepID=A0A8B7XTQ5_ACAPL|nr:solute carrier family 46 member 3-like [Acanthaster planci]
MEDSKTERTPILPAKTTSSLERARRRWVTVEPIIVLGTVGVISTSLIRPFYLKERLGESMFNITEQDEYSKCQANASDGGMVEDDVQAEASLWILYLSTAANIPMIVSSVILGALSDRLGRKMCMVIPLVGYICQEIVYILTVCYHLPLPVLFAGDILQGMGGSFGLLFAGCLSYISDITTEKQRTMRIAVVEMLMLFIGGCVEVGAGFLMRDIGPFPPLALALGFNVLCLIYIAIPSALIETVDRDNIPENRKGLKEAGRSVVAIFKFTEDGRRWQTLLLTLFLFFITLNVHGVTSIFILYGTAQPFCWSAVTAGLVASFVFVVGSLGMVAGTKVFSFCLGEYFIMHISCLSFLASNLVMGVSRTTVLVFVASGLGTLRGMAFPVARSVLSKIVNPNDIGAAFAIVACADNLAGFAASLIAPSVYAATVSYLPPAVFFVFSGLAFIPNGTHWVSEIMNCILHDGKADFDRSYMVNPLEATIAEDPIKMQSTAPGYKVCATMKSPRCIISHCMERFRPPQVLTKNAKVVYVARNPKDVVVSTFKMMPKWTFDEALWAFYHDKMMYGSWFDHVLGYWTEQGRENFLLLKYEDLHKDLRGSVCKLAKHVGKDLPDDIINGIVEHVTFDRMQTTYQQLEDRYGEDGKRMTRFRGTPYLRKGEVGDWKNVFTVAQNTLFDKIYTKRTEGTGLEFDFELSA